MSSNLMEDLTLKTIYKFPKRIRILRELHDYTQEYVADCLGITQSAYSRVEKSSAPSFERILKVINIYKITFEEFIEFDLNKIILKNNLKL